MHVCLDLLIQLFPPGPVPSAAVKATDSSSEWLCRGWRLGAGSAGRSESGGGECRHGSVLPQVWYVWHLVSATSVTAVLCSVVCQQAGGRQMFIMSPEPCSQSGHLAPEKARC